MCERCGAALALSDVRAETGPAATAERTAFLQRARSR
jgi:hypothetical protein